LREIILRRNIFDWTISVLDSAVSLGLRLHPTEPVEPSTEAAPPA